MKTQTQNLSFEKRPVSMDPFLPAQGFHKESYPDLVERLSTLSVRKHYGAFTDIDWEAPEYQMDHGDPRWEKSEGDTLGETHWYRSQPQETRSAIGLWSIVSSMKLGLVFENILKRGMYEFASTLPDTSPEFRYVYHEVIEEVHHSLMFQEFVNRSGLDPQGLGKKEAGGVNFVVSLGRNFPELFYMFVLGGEAPIDYEQRRILENREGIHPLLRRIMQIHTTEEARHLAFAGRYLERKVPALPSYKKWILARGTPIILSQMARMMMQAPTSLIQAFKIPKEVVAEAYTNNPAHKSRVAHSLASVRKLCGKLGLLTPRSLRLWTRLGLDPPLPQGHGG